MRRNRRRPRQRKPEDVFLPVDDVEEAERRVLARSWRFRTVIETAQQEIRAGKGMGHEDFWRAVDASSE